MMNKLFRSHFTASMVSFTLCLLVVFAVLYSYFVVESTKGLKEEAKYISVAVGEYGMDYLARTQQDLNTRITLISSDGTVLFDTQANPEKMENHADREEFIKALEYGEGESFRYSSTLAERTINYAVKLSSGDVLRLSRTQYSIVYILANTLLPLMIIIAAAIVISAVIAMKMAERITKPINEINLENPDDRDVYDELKPIVRRISFQNKQIHKQMEELKAEHKKSDDHRREFTANVSHELKTPLTSISGYAEIIRDGIAAPEDVPRFAEKIYKEAQRLINLVEDIIELSMVEDNDVNAERSDVDMLLLCEEMTEIVMPSAEKRGINIKVEGEHAAVYGVRKILGDVVYNLVDNAVKYNKDGGSVTVSVIKKYEGTEISVSDTGVGIPKEDVNRVFERFYRVNKSHSREIGGTGLGLSIVKHGVNFHKGKVSIESEYGRGTKITVLFRQ